MSTKLPTLVGKILRRLGFKSKLDKRIERLYRTKDYLEAYSRHTDIRVQIDPQEAVGGNWEAMGQLQLEFLVGQGLLPNHTFLDIGCGTLRGGRRIIAYLNRGNYWGIDISAKAIEYAGQLLREEQLSEKKPRLILLESKNQSFGELGGQLFDFLLAQSVFTHLPPQIIKECLRNIGRVMKPSSIFFFTFSAADSFNQTNRKHFCYPYSFFAELAQANHFVLKDRSECYNHPGGQKMLEMMKKPSPSSKAGNEPIRT